MWNFELVTIRKTQPPTSSAGGSWYHYTIANQITTVSGCRRGSRAEVMNFIKSTIQRLNNRHLSCVGKYTVTQEHAA